MWGVPSDHEMFKEINPAQWLWYYHNFVQDQNEKFELNRDMVEYNASFIEPEAVKKIRDARDKAIEIPDEQFASGIEQMFGRSLTGNAERPKEKEIQKADIGKILTEYKSFKNIDIPKGLSYKDWLNIDLEK